MAAISESGFSKFCKTVGEVAPVAAKVLRIALLVAGVGATIFGLAALFVAAGGVPLALTFIATIGTAIATHAPATAAIGSIIVALGISYLMIPDRKGGDKPSPHSVVEPYDDSSRSSTSSTGSQSCQIIRLEELEGDLEGEPLDHPTPPDTQGDKE